ncbi:MAG: ScpA family protein [Nesterenkonia sp.]|nr:ScpA family protein [Nesterenkonia sp.]
MSDDVVDPEAELEGASGFTVRLENFDGPFDLLLGLIAKRRMDITAVALASVTDEFITYVKTLSGEDGGYSPKALDESSNFVLVAATLLDLKTAQLLPSGEVESEEDVAALEARDLLFARLLQYRAFKEIAAHIRTTMEQNTGRFPRSPGTDPQLTGLLPELVWRTSAEDLAAIAQRAFERPEIEPDDVRLEHLHAHSVSIRDEVASMAQRLRDGGSLSFTELITDAPNRLVVVVRFLGLLELFRDRDVEFAQEAPLAELTVTWSGAASGDSAAADRAAEEWDGDDHVQEEDHD